MTTIMEYRKKDSKFKKLAITFGFIAILGGAAAYYYISSSNTGIFDYNPQKDRESLLKIFKDNWYWLISEYSYDFSAEHVLDTRSSSNRPSDLGNLTIKVYRDNDKTVGFTGYYMKPFFEGHLLFLAMDEKARGKGYARQLMQYALDDMKRRGATFISLDARSTNLRAHKLYKGLGFFELTNDGRFIRFRKVLN